MSTRVPQNGNLIKNLFDLLEAHRPAFGQERVFLRVVGLVPEPVGDHLHDCSLPTKVQSGALVTTKSLT